MRKILFDRQIEAGRRRRFEVWVAGRDVAAAAVDRGCGRDLLESGACDGRGDCRAGDQVGFDLIARLWGGEEVGVAPVSPYTAYMNRGVVNGIEDGAVRAGEGPGIVRRGAGVGSLGPFNANAGHYAQCAEAELILPVGGVHVFL